RGERNGKALSGADFSLRSSQSSSHKIKTTFFKSSFFVFVDESVQLVASRQTYLRKAVLLSQYFVFN
ncbi:MAG: hypothetical protein II214_05530, partial [Alistipes sp.]|nr:hypothetical protein [Alistipes sp.]